VREWAEELGGEETRIVGPKTKEPPNQASFNPSQPRDNQGRRVTLNQVNLPSAKSGGWVGTAKELHVRANNVGKTFPKELSTASGGNIRMNADGRRKTLYSLRTAEEFAGFAHLEKITGAAKKISFSADNKNRPSVLGFNTYATRVKIGEEDFTAEITSRIVDSGSEIFNKFYFFRMHGSAQNKGALPYSETRRMRQNPGPTRL